MNTKEHFSRRSFLKLGVISGIGMYMLPASRDAWATLFQNELSNKLVWDRDTNRVAYRIDGIAKVMGKKVFAIDVRARDMPHWPDEQSYAHIVRITTADEIFSGIDLSMLGSALQPYRIVMAKDLNQDNLNLPSFYGTEPFLPIGKVAMYLGQPVAMLLFKNFAQFNSAMNILQFNQTVIQTSGKGPLREYDPYGGIRFVRVEDPVARAEDVFSPLKNAVIYPKYKNHQPVWPNSNANGTPEEVGMAFADEIQKTITSPPDNWLVMTKEYSTQSVDAAAMEPDNSNGWFDQDTNSLHLVITSQSPREVAEGIAEMLSNSRLTVKNVYLYPCETVGYGTKDHSIFPYYGLIATLYAGSRPVLLANNRYEQFQSTMKRHAFNIASTIAVDKNTNKFQLLKTSLISNGGGRANFSFSLTAVGTSASQSIYYFPISDLQGVSNYSRAIESGSMRGYGALESIFATETLVDEIAHALNIDPIDLRLINSFKAGLHNTQGIIPVGVNRISDVLIKTRAHRIWDQRIKNKSDFESKHKNKKYGVGFAIAMKDFGCGNEASFAKIEIDPQGKITLFHTGVEIGTGMSTSQAVNCNRWLGRPADTVQIGLLEWPELPMKSSGDPFAMDQSEQDRLSQDALWTPQLVSSSSASNSAFFMSHTTLEASYLILKYGLWPAALSIWSQGIDGGMASSEVVRLEDARWTEAGLTAAGLPPIAIEELAALAHRENLVTGVIVHGFNRLQWAESVFVIDKQDVRIALDGLSIRQGNLAYTPLERKKVFYPKTKRNDAYVTYYSVAASLVELSVDTAGTVELLSHHHVVDCGLPIVPELVSGQIQGGVVMGIGMAMFENLPLYEDGPANGTWNFAQYELPRASNVAVWSSTSDVLKPLTNKDPSKAVAEVVMIPIIPAISNAVFNATGRRIRSLPITADKIRGRA